MVNNNGESPVDKAMALSMLQDAQARGEITYAIYFGGVMMYTYYYSSYVCLVTAKSKMIFFSLCVYPRVERFEAFR